MRTKIKTGDKVEIISGNYKRKQGIVNSIIKDKVIIKDINIRTKHIKPKQTDEKGYIKKIECPIHYSNIKLIAKKKTT
uniref:Large ribosomal subunit protein uL24c n=1 Tax=Polysiphonia urceolata TaxID=173545 RepID=A0A1Z1MC63_POLUR|nr:ribosomal protein L24 [Polysiphonia stricta]ARW63570.1 ribosomal protein L24 [Polysiphonia stricta]